MGLVWCRGVAASAVLAALAVPGGPVQAQAPQPEAELAGTAEALFAPGRTSRVTGNLYGGAGLVQMRNARLKPDGTFEVGGSSGAGPVERYFINFQALPFLETTARYSIGRGLRTGGRDQFDRSFDLKLRVLNETDIFPALAIGLQDFAGTGVYSGEYVVASKLVGPVDLTAGVAWGRLGSRADVRNPLGVLSNRFDARTAEIGRGGTPSPEDWFSGEDVGLFAGAEWRTPVDGLNLKLELTGDNFVRERAVKPGFDVPSRINAAISYQPWPWLDTMLAFENGERVSFRVSLRYDPKAPDAVFDLEPEPVDVVPRSQVPANQGIAPTQVPSTAGAGSVGSGYAPPAAALGGLAAGFGIPVLETSVEGDTLVVHTVRDPAAVNPELLLAVARRIETADPPGIASLSVRPAGGGGDFTLALETTARQTARSSPSAGAQLASMHHGSDLPVPGLAQAADPAASQAPGQTGGQPEDRIAAAEALKQALADGNLTALAVDVQRYTATIHLTSLRYNRQARTIGRAARIAAGVLPPSVEEIEIVALSNGLEISRVALMRRDLERMVALSGSPEELWQTAEIRPTTGAISADAVVDSDAYPSWSLIRDIHLRQQTFDPDDPYRYQLDLIGGLRVRPTRNTILTGKLAYGLFGTLDQQTRESNSTLPRVRSDVGEYLREADFTIRELHGMYFDNLGPNVYGRVSAGIFESMFGGVSAEVLHRPRGKRYAYGLEVNQVWQRDFEQMLTFQDYNVTTGHASLYYEIPFHDLLFTVHAGRFLARDWGARFELSRRFRSGLEVGGWSTFTNVPFDEFGEGSFDKGIYFSLPLETILPFASVSSVGQSFQSLARDGGQRVVAPGRLYRLTDRGAEGVLHRTWHEVLE